MWIFIKGIPEEMDARSLRRQIGRLFYLNWLPKTANGRVKITGSKILKIVHTRTYSTEYHGLIQIHPEDQAERVVERIKLAEIKGRKLDAHPYNRRVSRIDRRRVHRAEGMDERPERRQIQRRRNHLVSQVVDASL